MKHTFKVTLLLILLFIAAQVVGLSLISKSMSVTSEVINNETVTVTNYSETAVGERPDMSPAMTFLYIIFAVGLGTVLVLLLIKFRKPTVWKIWFLLAVMFTIAISLGVLMKFWYAYVIAFIFAIWKVYRPNVYVHNLTEVLMYSGIAIVFVPMFRGKIMWAFVLLLIISLYDIYAVWKSKHMVDMAKFQTSTGVFAGLNISYSVKKTAKTKAAKELKVPTPSNLKSSGEEQKNAILGGGDIAFPMIFSGVVMESLIRNIPGMTKSVAYLEANIITLFVTMALALLFFYAKKDKFYPAMPFVTAGAIIGFIIVLLLNTTLLSSSFLF